LRHSLEAEGRRLLRVLFVRRRKVPTDTTGGNLLQMNQGNQTGDLTRRLPSFVLAWGAPIAILSGRAPNSKLDQAVSALELTTFFFSIIK
jgi:hypothetical protein